MSEVEKARRVLEEERESILSELRRVQEERSRLLEGVARLLLRGKDAGATVVEMAEALGMSRQWAHRLIREAENERSDG